jgi:TatD DNase family protein
MFVDMHVHCTELNDLSKYRGNYVLVCVSDNLESSYTTIEISEKYEYVKPCIGIHPWLAHEYAVKDALRLLEKLASSVQCLGEVGLDKKFKPDTLDKQLVIFNVFLDYAREYDLLLNLHAAGAWDMVFQLVYSKNINKAYFHWYTGPLSLADQITSVGYFIGANPALVIQDKHRQILDHVRLESILTESDGPYNYRGLNLTPELIDKAILYLSEKKHLEPERVKDIVYGNFRKLFK